MPRKICQEHHFKKIGILTSGYHVNRAYAMSRKFFDDIIMFHAPYRFTLKKMLREYISRYQYLYIEIKNYLKKKERKVMPCLHHFFITFILSLLLTCLLHKISASPQTGWQ